MSATTAGGRVVLSLIDERQEYHRLLAGGAREAARRAGLAVETLFAENKVYPRVDRTAGA